MAIPPPPPPGRLFMWWNFMTKVKAFPESAFSSLQLNLKFYQHFGVRTLYKILIKILVNGCCQKKGL